MLIVMTFALSLSAFAQKEGEKKQITIDDVPLATTLSYVFYSDLDIEQKFSNAQLWIATTFGDNNAVLQYADNEHKRIIIKGGTPIRHDYEESIQFNFAENYTFTMVFDFKQDRYRIRFENIQIMNNSSWGKKQDLIPVNVVTLYQRFGDDLPQDHHNQIEVMKVRNAFYELFKSASIAIEDKSDF